MAYYITHLIIKFDIKMYNLLAPRSDNKDSKYIQNSQTQNTSLK